MHGETLTEEMKIKITGSSQASKKAKTMRGMTVASALRDSIVGIEPIQNVREAAMAMAKDRQATTQRAASQSKLLQNHRRRLRRSLPRRNKQR
jgi:hypothetical protein